MALTIKIPEVPRDISLELHNYFVQLQLNLQLMTQEINSLRNEVNILKGNN